MLRRVLSCLVAAAVLASSGTAWAQASTVTRDATVEIGNNAQTACAPSSEGTVSLVQGGADPVQIDTIITDAQGLFVYSTSGLPLGDVQLIVECGAEAAIVWDLQVVEPETPFYQRVPVLGAIGAVIVLLGALLLVQRRKRAAGDDDASSIDDDPLLAPQTAMDADEDDGAEYWVWDHESDAGPRKRVACLTEQGFYLHELSSDGFPFLLQTIQQAGPDAGLADAYYRFFVKDIGEVARRGNLLRITNRLGQAQVIDVGTAAEDVFAMLRRRLGENVCHDVTVPSPVS